MTALRPGMIGFEALDLGRSMGDQAIGCAKSSEKYYPSIWIDDRPMPIDLPDEGEATIRYKVRRRSTEERDGKKKHSASLDVISIDTGAKTKKAAAPDAAKKLALSALRPGAIEFDGRPRDENGQYVANQTGGIDPSSMAAAYGSVAQRKKPGLLARLRSMVPGV